ncbi:MAG TPA: toll/interleukin-1 receptor domain-containing protein [Ktedonobacterales bacterium]|nr:toll/interleukin-1 receptor domain-containing protein [Ktedonobacterales bacterium]
MAKVSKVFISYRRDDAADLAGRIRDRMIQNWRLSKENVFMDIDNIKVGADFMQVIERTIRECQAMVILISPSWLAQVNKPGVSYVRVEAELAIRFRLRLIPILVGGAKLPGADQLPESLRPLTNLNIRPVRPDAFDFDLDAVRRSLGIGRGPGISVFAAISALLLVAIGAGTLSQTPRGNPIYDLAHPRTAPSATQRTAAHVSLSFQTASIDTDSSASAQSPASVTVHCGNAGKLLGGGFSLEPVKDLMST